MVHFEDEYSEAWEQVQASPETIDDPKLLGHAAGFEAVRTWRAEHKGEKWKSETDSDTLLETLIEAANEYIDRVSEHTEKLSPLDEDRAREVAKRWLDDFVDDELDE